MDIKLTNNVPFSLNPADTEKQKDDMALEFEKIFARQMVQEMTKGLFKNDDNKPLMGAGNDLYREHIVDTLSQELAEQRQLGMADMITRYIENK